MRFKVAKMRLKMAKMRLKMPKMRPKMVRMRLKTAKMRPKVGPWQILMVILEDFDGRKRVPGPSHIEKEAPRRHQGATREPPRMPRVGSWRWARALGRHLIKKEL